MGNALSPALVRDRRVARLQCLRLRSRVMNMQRVSGPAQGVPNAIRGIANARICAVLSCLLASWACAQQLDPECGNPFVSAVGPFDYRIEQGANRKIVEDYHFAPRVESLISGQSGSLGGDIDYTLRAFPNHHRALVSMMNLGGRLKSERPVGSQFSVECYFKRAITFRPDDHVARMLYAKYLSSTARKLEATRQLEYTTEQTKDNGFAQFNVGLLYMEMGEFEKALAQAHAAQRLGFEGSKLRERLMAAGKWADAPGVAAEPAASAASAQPR